MDGRFIAFAACCLLLLQVLTLSFSLTLAPASTLACRLGRSLLLAASIKDSALPLLMVLSVSVYEQEPQQKTTKQK
jgi:hypothetical protein